MTNHTLHAVSDWSSTALTSSCLQCLFFRLPEDRKTNIQTDVGKQTVPVGVCLSVCVCFCLSTSVCLLLGNEKINFKLVKIVVVTDLTARPCLKRIRSRSALRVSDVPLRKGACVCCLCVKGRNKETCRNKRCKRKSRSKDAPARLPSKLPGSELTRGVAPS